MIRKQAVSALTLLLSVTLVSVVRADDSSVKRVIQAKYQSMADSIRHKDAKVMMSCLAPDFTNIDERGGKTTRSQFEKQMTDVISSIKRVDRISFDVEKIAVKGSEAIVDCRSRFLMQIVDNQGMFGPKGRQHQLEVDSLDKETWIKSGSTWLLKSSITGAGGKFLVDGKAPGPPKAQPVKKK